MGEMRLPPLALVDRPTLKSVLFSKVSRAKNGERLSEIRLEDFLRLLTLTFNLIGYNVYINNRG